MTVRLCILAWQLLDVRACPFVCVLACVCVFVELPVWLFVLLLYVDVCLCVRWSSCCGSSLVCLLAGSMNVVCVVDFFSVCMPVCLSACLYEHLPVCL